MWLQYVADVGSAAEQVEAPSIRTSLRRMSQAILVLEKRNGQDAAVLPEEGKEGSETAGSTEANDDDTDDELRSKDNKVSFVQILATSANTIVLGIIMLGYPVAVLPYYRAESTTE